MPLFLFFPVRGGPAWWKTRFDSLFLPPVDFLWVDCGRLMRQPPVLSSPICFVKKISHVNSVAVFAVSF